MFKKLSFKLAIQIVIILIVVTGLFVPVYLRFQKEAYISSRIRDVNAFCEKLTSLSMETNKKEIKALIRGENASGLRIRVYDETGKLLYATRRMRRNRTFDIGKKQKKYSTNTKAKYIVRKKGKKSAIVLKRMVIQDGKVYYIQIREIQTAMDSVLAYANRNLLYILIGYILVCCLGIVVLVNVSIRKIKLLTHIAKQIAKKDYDIRYDGKISKDEIGELSIHINEMADTIRENITSLDNYNFFLKKELNYATHELKTPLAIISSQVEMLRNTKNEEKKQFYYESIVEEVEKMSMLISSFLKFSVSRENLFEGELEDVNLSENLKELCKKSESYAAFKKIKITTKIEPKCTLFMEKNHIIHVYNNYLSNAIRHTQPGGTIRVELKKRENRIRLSVFNQGEPISDKDNESIWHEFFSASDSSTGLGLFIVKEIATIEQTDCGFDNVKDGVEFWFDFKEYIDKNP